jgi:MoaA/NifB/PqqE/SkfB family radical SAM enzyme
LVYIFKAGTFAKDELTQRCNNKCVHCYNNLATGDQEALAKELSLNEHYRIIDEITE